MGCGKTRIGKQLAKALGAEFYDLDKYITEREGMSIPDIFSRFGEAHFRKLEAKYISDMPEGSVTALGGGAIINDDTAKTARESGTVVFLDAAFETCYGRIKDDKNRPLAVNSTKEQLKELYDKRKSVYRERSDIIIKAKGTPKTITAAAVTAIEKNDEK